VARADLGPPVASTSARIAWEPSVVRAFASFPGHLVRSSAARMFDRRSMDALLPLVLACLTFTTFAILVPHYLSVVNVQQLMRDFAEPGLVAVAMAITILAGGIDLSVGATFALADFVALYLFRIQGFSLSVAVAGALATGVAVGTLNGLLIAYIKARPFLTTLATLLILRAVFNLVSEVYTTELAIATHESTAWDFLGDGSVLGLPANMLVLCAVGLFSHFFLTRIRAGLHIMAVGASRKAARHAGIDVRRSLLMAYILSGAIAALAGLLYAARQSAAGSDTALGFEVTALAGVVAGGVSIGGGRGTVGRAILGAALIFLLVSGLLRVNASASLASATIGLILLLAGGLTATWPQIRTRLMRTRHTPPGDAPIDGRATTAGPSTAASNIMADVQQSKLKRPSVWPDSTTASDLCRPVAECCLTMSEKAENR
jgi:ribose transport system permease protein